MLLWNFIFKFSFNLCAFLFYSNIIGFNEKLQDPMISKMILSACNFGCSEEIITIAAVLSVQVIFCSFKVKLLPCERCLMFMDACSLFGFLCGEHRRNLMKWSYVLLLQRYPNQLLVCGVSVANSLVLILLLHHFCCINYEYYFSSDPYMVPLAMEYFMQIVVGDLLGD